MEEQRSTRSTSKGECEYCHRAIGRSGMARHLESCPKRRAVLEEAASAPGAKKQKLLHLTVAGRDRPEYWMHLEVPAKSTLEELDEFLRDVWLECCGHMSAFTIGSREYLTAPMDLEEALEPGDLTMEYPLNKLLRPGMSFLHEYDFGTTTELILRVVSTRVAVPAEEGVALMSRNLPPDLRCVSCGEPATQVCSLCVHEDEGWLCDRCAEEHECGEEYLLPVVNSPRVGECAYTG